MKTFDKILLALVIIGLVVVVGFIGFIVTREDPEELARINLLLACSQIRVTGSPCEEDEIMAQHEAAWRDCEAKHGGGGADHQVYAVCLIAHDIAG